MKKKLRIFGLLMAVMMFICCLPIDVFADSFIVAGEEFEYHLNDEGTYTITGYSGESDIVEIPAYIDGIEVTVLGSHSLYNEDIREVTLPATIKEIRNNALTCNTNMTSVDVADDSPYFCDIDGVLFNKDVTKIVYYPEGKEDKTYTLPQYVTTLGEYSFHYTPCEVINLPHNLKKIETRAFYGAWDLKTISLPSGLEYIGDGAFYYCENITDLVIPDSVVNIGGCAFSDCSKLKNIHFGSGIENIGYEIFSGCYSLEKISVSEGNKVLSVDNGVLFNKEKTELIKYPVKKTDSSYAVPSSVKTINTSAFSSVENIEKLTLPEGLETIEDEAFSGLTALKEIRLPDSLVNFGHNFGGCSALEKVYIGKNVEYTEEYSSFRECCNLKTFEVNPENKNYSSMNGVLFNKDKTKLFKYPAGLSVENYIIPDSVKEVRSLAFSDCEGYYDDLDDDGEAYVGDCLLAFNSYISKKQGNISVKTGTRVIGSSAFWAQQDIWGVSLPDEIRYICSYAFSACDYLQAIYIPAGVKYIGNDAFWASNMLTEIYYGGTEEQWNKIENIENADISEYATIHFESTGNEYVNPVLPEDDYLHTYEDTESGVSVSTDTDAALSVEDIKTQEIVDSVAELLPKAKVESVYEINLRNEEDEEIQPVDKVLVKIPTKNRFARVYRMEEDGTLTDMNARYEDGYLWFYTDHFSYYALGMKQAEHYELGDVDMDERINVKDATAVQKHLTEVTEYQQDVIDLLMDYDQNDTINVKDATAIQKKVAGLI